MLPGIFFHLFSVTGDVWIADGARTIPELVQVVFVRISPGIFDLTAPSSIRKATSFLPKLV
jgi:hypothetical protein